MTLHDLPLPKEAIQWIVDTLHEERLREPSVAAGQCDFRTNQLSNVLAELGYINTQVTWVYGFRGDHTGHGWTGYGPWIDIWNNEFGHCVLRLGANLEYVIDMTSAQLGPQHPVVYTWDEFKRNWHRLDGGEVLNP